MSHEPRKGARTGDAGRRTGDAGRRTGPDPLGRLRAGADVVVHVRRSIVGVRTVATAGTGWVALGNGLVLTSHEAVGYHADVTIELPGGRRTPGRVIWADVTRDLALVLPREPLGLPPLLARPDLPKLGEAAFALSLVPGQPFRVASVVVSAVDVKVGPLRCFEIDTPADGPLVDLDGRVIGIAGLDLPRGARRRAAARADVGTERFRPALPITALLRALAAFDLPTEQFEGRAPTYRCPSCTEPYAVDLERCLNCGQRLPHVWDVAPAADAGDDADPITAQLPATPPAFAAAERIVREMLARHGAGAGNARVGPRTWRLLAPGPNGAVSQTSEITLELDEQARTLRGRVPLVRVPATSHEPFYRFLLQLNDQTARSQRFFLDGDVVYLGFAEPIALLADASGADLLEALIRSAPEVRKTLAEAFEAKAAL